MSNIKIVFKDGTVREFKHEGRAGGSYTKRLKTENGFIIIEDEWYKKTLFPASEVVEVIETPHDMRF